MDVPLDFDLSLIPRRERFAFWHDVGSLIQRPVRTKYQDPDSLMVHARLLLSGDFILGQMTASPQHFERSGQMIRQDQVDSLLLVLMVRGSAHWSGKHQQLSIQSGDLLLLDNQDSSQSEWTAHQQIYAAIPRDLLKAAGWAAPQTSVLRAGDPRAVLLSQHLRTLWRLPQSDSSGLKPELALGLASLTGLYFRNQHPLQAAELEDSRGALLLSIRQWLDDNLHRRDLDAAAIAASFHLSRSTLYEIFRPWGGIRAYIQSRRLEIAREILESAERRLSISQLAIRLGFRSVSSFSRAFSDRWGVSPKQARQQASSQPLPAPLDGDTASAATATESPSLDAMKEGTQRYYKAVQRLSRYRGASSPPP